MPAKTYKTSTNEYGNTEFITYKVWYEKGKAKSRTFADEDDAIRSFDDDGGARLDMIVTTVLRRK